MPAAIEKFLGRRTGSAVKIVTGENVALLEQLRLGQLDLVVGRLAAPEQMVGLNFVHLYTERVVFVVHAPAPFPLLGIARRFDFARIRDFTVLMPTHGSIIRPFAERFLISHGIAEIPVEIETVSDSFGRAMTRQSDAIWIISEGVVAADTATWSGRGVLPIDTAETRGAVGLTTRADGPELPAARLFSTGIRRAVKRLRLSKHQVQACGIAQQLRNGCGSLTCPAVSNDDRNRALHPDREPEAVAHGGPGRWHIVPNCAPPARLAHGRRRCPRR